MRIALLEIENFRGIRSGKVVFGDHSVLIGPNNSGKTTVVEALALILGRDRLVRSLTEHDFFGSDPAANDRLKIVATVTGFGTEDPADHSDWFRDGRGVPFWFDPEMEGIVPDRANDTQTLACQIIFSARFDRDSLEVETARYFADADDIDVFGEESFVSVPPKLIRELGLVHHANEPNMGSDAVIQLRTVPTRCSISRWHAIGYGPRGAGSTARS